jgi:hypothetical protein
MKSPHTKARRAHRLAQSRLAQSKVCDAGPGPIGPIFREHYAPIWGVREFSGIYSFSRLKFLEVWAWGGNLTHSEATKAMLAMRETRADIRASEKIWAAYRA